MNMHETHKAAMIHSMDHNGQTGMCIYIYIYMYTHTYFFNWFRLHFTRLLSLFTC